MAGKVTRKKKNSKQSILDDDYFFYTLTALKSACRPAKPVQLVFKKLPDSVLGQCRMLGNKFIITLNSAMGGPQATDVLVHEWAHALAWNYLHNNLSNTAVNQSHFDKIVHDEAWGCAYSKTYRAYLIAQSVLTANTAKPADAKK